MRTRLRRAAVLTLGAAIFGLGGAVATASSAPTLDEMRDPSVLRSFATMVNIADDETAVPAGTIDDGADRLPEATIALDDAIAAAQGAVTGPIGDVDLEDWNGTLVFNIDVGSWDVKVNAATGAVLATDTDD